MDSPAASAASAILGSKGEKLHTHEMHIRRTDNKGFVAKHDLRNEHGQHPQDGQKSDAEYALANKKALLAHIDQAIPDEEEPGAAGAAPQGAMPPPAASGPA